MISFFSLMFYKYVCPKFASAEEDTNYLLNDPLTESIYYKKKKSVKLKDLVQSHSLLLEIIENILRVFTPHEMREYNHYIIKHIVLHNKFNIISKKVFDPSKEIPVSKHNIIGYKDKFYVLSICNHHDTWLDVIKIKN